MAYFYKGTNIQDMVQDGSGTMSSSTGGKYSDSTGLNLATTNTVWKKYDTDTGFPYNYKISGGASIPLAASAFFNMSDSANLAIPSWADAFKFHIETAKGAQGDKGGNAYGHTNQCWQTYRNQYYQGGAGQVGGTGVKTYIANSSYLANAAGGQLSTSVSGNTRTLKVKNSGGGVIHNISVSKGSKGSNGNGATIKWNAQAGGYGSTPGGAGTAGAVNATSGTLPSTTTAANNNTGNSTVIQFFKL